MRCSNIGPLAALTQLPPDLATFLPSLANLYV